MAKLGVSIKLYFCSEHFRAKQGDEGYIQLGSTAGEMIMKSCPFIETECGICQGYVHEAKRLYTTSNHANTKRTRQ